MTSERSDIVHAEDVEAEFRGLLEIIEAEAERIRRLPGVVSTTGPARPDVTSLLSSRLREALEDEVVAATATPDGKIRQAELDREVIKKALVGLKTVGLRRVSRRAGLPVSRPIEELATNLAQYYQWDESQVARLVLENEETISADHGLSARLFPIRQTWDRGYVVDRLSYVRGRYIRTGLARWFLFQSVSLSEPQIEVAGELRTYSAAIDVRKDGEPQLSSHPTQAEATLALTEEGIVEVRGASAAVARQAVRALATAAQIEPWWSVPLDSAPTGPPPDDVRPSSRFLLDLLVNRLPLLGLTEFNLTVARFQVKDPVDGDLEHEGDQKLAQLRAVRFEGDYLLGSAAACRLLVVSQRPLTDITIQVTLRDGLGSFVGRFPCRIAIERDHVSIETGLGSGEHEQSAHVHRVVSTAVQLELIEGISNLERLKAFILRVAERATAPEASHSTDLLSED